MRKVLLLLITLLLVLAACAPAQPDTAFEAAPTTTAEAAEAPEAEAAAPAIETEKAAEVDVEEANGTAAGATSDAGAKANDTAVSASASLADSVLLSVFESRHQVRPVDPATGQDLAEYAPIDLGADNFWPVLAPDGRMLAAIDGAIRLHLVDLETWQDTVTELRFPNVTGMAFSPDGTRLALTFDDRKGPSLALVDVATQAIMARVELDFRPRWQQLYFTPDGRSLVVYGTGMPDMSNDREIPGPARIMVWNAADLALEWEANLAEVLDGVSCEKNCSDSHEGRTLWQPAVVMGSDGHSLFVVHAHEEKLTMVDLAGRTARSMPIEPAVSWLDRLIAATAGVAHAKMMEGTSRQAVISPDGSRLYAVGWQTDITSTENEMSYNETPLGLKVIDTATGREIAAMETEARQATLSADGRQLYLSGWRGEIPWTDVLDTKSLEVVTRLDGYRLVTAHRLDGRSVLLGSRELHYQTGLALVDEKSFEVVHSWTVNDYATWLTQP